MNEVEINVQNGLCRDTLEIIVILTAGGVHSPKVYAYAPELIEELVFDFILKLAKSKKSKGIRTYAVGVID